MTTQSGVSPAASGTVAVFINGPSERLVLDACAALVQEFPQVGGPAFSRALGALRSHFGQDAVQVLTGFTLLLAAMEAAGRLPRLRSRRTRAAGKDELLLVAMLAGCQHGDRGRAIEAAIALLDTGHVYRVIAAAKALAALLAEHNIRLRPIGPTMFDHVVGYPFVADPTADLEEPAIPLPRPPVLRLLRTA